MGRCQSGFCAPKVMKILARELKVDLTEITKFGGNSRLIIDKNQISAKDVEKYETL
jgi:glycerol-3-phosphate dehydrogenase